MRLRLADCNDGGETLGRCGPNGIFKKTTEAPIAPVVIIL